MSSLLYIKRGQRIGYLRVVGLDARVEQRSGTRKAALCRCDCGIVKPISLDHLRSGRITSCGCRARNRQRVRIEPGTRAGILTVVEETRRGRERMLRLRCDCGNEITRSLYDVADGTTKRCPAKVHNKPRSPGPAGHGLSKHELYGVHRSMMQRCHEPGHKDYKRYGARGIKVWKPWHDVKTFITDIEASIGPRPPGRYPSGWAMYTLDRIDNNAGYRPGNVRWCTRLEQARNLRPRPRKRRRKALTS